MSRWIGPLSSRPQSFPSAEALPAAGPEVLNKQAEAPLINRGPLPQTPAEAQSQICVEVLGPRRSELCQGLGAICRQPGLRVRTELERWRAVPRSRASVSPAGRAGREGSDLCVHHTHLLDMTPSPPPACLSGQPHWGYPIRRPWGSTEAGRVLARVSYQDHRKVLGGRSPSTQKE